MRPSDVKNNFPKNREKKAEFKIYSLEAFFVNRTWYLLGTYPDWFSGISFFFFNLGSWDSLHFHALPKGTREKPWCLLLGYSSLPSTRCPKVIEKPVLVCFVSVGRFNKKKNAICIPNHTTCTEV